MPEPRRWQGFNSFNCIFFAILPSMSWQTAMNFLKIAEFLIWQNMQTKHLQSRKTTDTSQAGKFKVN